MTEDIIMSRKGAADFLTISTRQLDRLGLARSKVGTRTLYMRSALMSYVDECRVSPVATGCTVKQSIKVPNLRARNAACGSDRRAEMMAMLAA
jgi:hypothetical protein